jgi:hypothetical protein
MQKPKSGKACLLAPDDGFTLYKDPNLFTMRKSGLYNFGKAQGERGRWMMGFMKIKGQGSLKKHVCVCVCLCVFF